ncbi:MAG: hypothetical protein Ct9H90mP3_7460 [Flammeovirgaceae bacterium]|nr:MAG: hypothetical protein Ct9H90mP3_7460 [Flammeovirgaceae bacterium]
MHDKPLEKLYGTTPNDHVIEASMDWFGRDIWPNLEEQKITFYVERR